MPISMLKYIKIYKTLRNVSISRIIIREYVCTSLKLLNYLKNIEFKNPEVHSRGCGGKTCSKYAWWPVWCCASNAQLHYVYYVQRCRSPSPCPQQQQDTICCKYLSLTLLMMGKILLETC